MIEHASGGFRADAGNQLNRTEPGYPIARIAGPAQQRQHILHMGRFEEPQTAELDEWNVAPHELQLQPRAVMRSAEQNGLRAQFDAPFAARQEPFDDVASLVGVVAH